MTTKQMNVRIDNKVERAASKALHAMGMTASDAVRILMVRIAKDQAFPLELKVPNAKTQAAMREGRERKNLKSFKTVKDLMADLNAED